MKIGKIEKYIIVELTEIGAYLDVDKTKVLLPKKQVMKWLNIGDEVEVFLYKDSKGRPIATIKKPILTVGDIGRLKVVDRNDIGCFLDIGLERDLLLPYSEQIGNINIGDYVNVLMYVDKSERLCATMFTKKEFYDENKKEVRKNKLDNKDVKMRQYELSAEKVYKIINEKFKGHLLYTDKTGTVEMIKKDFAMSKAEFKRSIGKLLKDNKLKITDLGIYIY